MSVFSNNWFSNAVRTPHSSYMYHQVQRGCVSEDRKPNVGPTDRSWCYQMLYVEFQRIWENFWILPTRYTYDISMNKKISNKISTVIIWCQICFNWRHFYQELGGSISVDDTHFSPFNQNTRESQEILEGALDACPI